MKKSIHPAVSVVIVVVVVGVAVMLGWNSLGPRTDGPKEPIDMSKAMGKASAAPSSGGMDMSKMMGKGAPPSTTDQGGSGANSGGQ